MFYLAPVLGLFSLLAVYLAVREFWDRVVALAATFLLAVNLVEIWQARLPTAEILSQFLLFSGLFMTARYIKKGEVYMAWLGGSHPGAIDAFKNQRSLDLGSPGAVFLLTMVCIFPPERL